MYSLFRDQWLEKKNSSFSTPKHIIRALTSNFRKKLVLKFIDSLDSIEDASAKHSSITILDTILIIYDALNKLAQITIFNCWTCPSQVRLFQYLNLRWCRRLRWLAAVHLGKTLNNQLPITNEELEQCAVNDVLSQHVKNHQKNIFGKMLSATAKKAPIIMTSRKRQIRSTESCKIPESVDAF